MERLTLVIPAKNESESLPKVLEELKTFDLKVIVVIPKNDELTKESIKNFNCKIIEEQNGQGYGNALRTGISNVETDLFCIFNADGSFNPIYLKDMIDLITNEKSDFVFCSRYEKSGGSDDDTFLTYIGNKIFTFLCNILFNLNISDVLFTYVLGKTSAFKEVNLKSENFNICVELPIKAQRKNMAYTDFASKERSRIAGFKKVNEFRDGFKILFYMLALLFSRKDK